MLTLIKRKLDKLYLCPIKIISEQEKFIRDIKDYCVMIKVSILKEDKATLNTYGPNSRASEHMRQKLMCKEKILEYQKK